MNLPIIVDVVISLVFIYLVLSLLAAEIQELIATILQWRAKHLKDSIINLLSGDTTSENSILKSKKLAQQLYSHPLLNSVNQESRGLFALLFRRITWIFSSVYEAIVGKDDNFGSRKTAPSYISPDTFATALLEQLGVGKYAEGLYEVKFDKFHKIVIKKIGEIVSDTQQSKVKEANEQPEDETNEQPENEANEQLEDKAIKQLKKRFKNISEQFKKRKITLETGIDNTSAALKSYIQKLPDSTYKNKLATWQENFFGEKNELAIINGGIKPTLQEITDSMDTASRTYQEYRKELNDYRTARNNEAVEELEKFLNLINISFKKLFNIKAIPSDLTKNSDQEELVLDNSDFIEDEQPDSKSKKPEESQKSQEELEESQKFQKYSKPKIPLYLVDDKILEIIEQKKAGNKQEEALLKAFIEGFSGQKSVVKSEETHKVFVILVLFLVFLGITVVLICHPMSIAGYLGGISFLILWLVLFPLCILLSLGQSFPSKSEKASIRYETLASLLDKYFATQNNTKEFQIALDEYLENNNKPDKAEIRDLGRSFRRYHQRLVLDYADVDLPFIPTSVKENIALLAKKTKLKADKLENQITQLGEEVGNWFDSSMERSIGVYKRNAKGIAILIGFLIAVITNANSIYMIDRLSFDKELRQVMIESSEQLISEVEPSDGLTKQDIRELNQKYADIFHNINLPIGWDVVLFSHQVDCEISQPQKSKSPSQKQDEAKASQDENSDTLTWKKLFDYCLSNNQENKPNNYFVPTSIMLTFLTNHKYWLALNFIIGWLLTGIAISMGSSFWFDLLGKLINVRNTGVKELTGVQRTSSPSQPPTTTTSSSQ